MSIGINNVMVRSNDLTLTECQLKCVLFSIIVNTCVFTTCGIYMLLTFIYSIDIMKEMNGPQIHKLYEWTK